MAGEHLRKISPRVGPRLQHIQVGVTPLSGPKTPRPQVCQSLTLRRYWDARVRVVMTFARCCRGWHAGSGALLAALALSEGWKGEGVANVYVLKRFAENVYKCQIRERRQSDFRKRLLFVPCQNREENIGTGYYAVFSAKRHLFAWLWDGQDISLLLHKPLRKTVGSLRVL